MQITIKQHQTDSDMIELYTKHGRSTYLAGVVHEDMFSDLFEDEAERKEALDRGEELSVELMFL
jgi:hypothetical protein